MGGRGKRDGEMERERDSKAVEVGFHFVDRLQL